MNLKMEKLVINLFMTDEISNKTPLILYNWLHQHTTKFERHRETQVILKFLCKMVQFWRMKIQFIKT